MLVSAGALAAATSLAVPAIASASPPGSPGVRTTLPPTGAQLAELADADASAYDVFGLSVAISSTTIVVGEPTDGAGTGETFVFTKTDAGWDETP